MEALVSLAGGVGDQVQGVTHRSIAYVQHPNPHHLTRRNIGYICSGHVPFK